MPAQTAAVALLAKRERILTIRIVTDMTGVSRSQIYKMIAEGTFPKQVKLTKQRVGWKRSEVYEWIGRLA